MGTRAAGLAIITAASAASAQDCVWNMISPMGKTAPAARALTTFAYDGARGRAIFYGGFSETIGNFSDTWEWDGQEWWRRVAPGPGPRFGHAMAFDPVRGRAILFGGSRSVPEDTRTWELFAPEWEPMPRSNSLPQPIAGMSMVHDPVQGRMIIFGDFGAEAPMRVLNPEGEWLALAIPGPAPRVRAQMVFDSDRSRIILYGGLAGLTVLSDVWEFDVAGSGSWTRMPDGPTPRYGGAAAYDPLRRRMIVSGGIASGQAWGLTDTWELDPATSTWIRRADDGPGGRVGAAMVFDAALGSVIHFGGGPFPYGLQSNEVFRFNGAGMRSVILQTLPQFQSLVIGQPLRLNVAATNVTTYQWVRNQLLLFNGGAISGAQSDSLVIDPASSCDGGFYVVQMSCGCGIADPGAQVLTPPECYVNCDGSTVGPILTANDFMCFLDRFVAGDCYANCTQNTLSPLLTPEDFFCYVNAFAAGCP